MTDWIDNAIHWLEAVAEALPWIGLIAGCLIILVFLAGLILRLLNIYRLTKQKAVLLEVTPPAQTDKPLEATRQLLVVLHGLAQGRSLWEKLLRQHVVFAAEVVGTLEQGIRFVVRVPKSKVPVFERALASHSSDAKIRRIRDYAPAIGYRQARMLEFKQAGRSYAYPLEAVNSLAEHDPVAYLTGALTKLAPGELIAIQLAISPAKIKDAHSTATRLLHNEELVYQLGKQGLLSKVLYVINSFLFGIVHVVSDIFHSSTTYRPDPNTHHRQQAAMKIIPARKLGRLEEGIAKDVYDKLTQPLFRVNIRAMIVMNDKQGCKERTADIRNWLGSFDTEYQSLKARSTFPRLLKGRFRLFMFRNRLLALRGGKQCILSAAELADLYHFPHTETVKTENIVKSLSKTLPAPLSLKGKTHFDVILGRNYHQGQSYDVGLTAAERERHVYVIGGTGNGKSTMLKYAIVQDIKNGKGVAVIDPHGDLARDILKHIPKKRINDVVYLNPVDIKYPIGLNMLELPEGLDADELLIEQERVTESVISVLRKVFSEDESGAHRIEDMLRNAIHTAMTIKGATLFTILKLLRNESYRKRIVADLEDEYLKDFWREEVGKAGAMQRVSMSKGVTARIDRFRTSAPAKRMLEQPKSTINFEDILNTGKILICNFAEGQIGEDTSALFGTTILAKLKMAAERRADMSEDDRRPFYVYVDEFQNFATKPFIKMLSGSRKYKLYLTIAQQSTAQQETQRMVEGILSNVSTVICFRIGSPADEHLLIERFVPYVELGEISNLPTYNFYARLSAIAPQEPVSGMTIVLKDKGSKAVAQEVIDASRANYAKEYIAKKVKKPKADKNKKTDTKAEPEKTIDDENLPEMDAPATA